MKPQWKAIDFKWIKENKDAVAWVGLERSSVGHWWLDNIRKGFEEGKTYECMGSRQLSKLVHISLGGGGVRIRVYDQIMHYVNCHLAAHLEVVNQRNADLITCIEIWSSIGHLYLTQQLLVCLLLLTRFGLQILRERRRRYRRNIRTDHSFKNQIWSYESLSDLFEQMRQIRLGIWGNLIGLYKFAAILLILSVCV